MKLVVRVKLLPTPAQAMALAATLAACNEAAGWVARTAFRTGQVSRSALQKACYLDLKERGLSAQPALHVLRKVADAYTALRANIRAGNLTGKGKVKAESTPINFRRDAAQPFDDRCLSWRHEARTVSIWTTAGRLKDIPFTGHPGQLTIVREHRRG